MSLSNLKHDISVPQCGLCLSRDRAPWGEVWTSGDGGWTVEDVAAFEVGG